MQYTTHYKYNMYRNLQRHRAVLPAIARLLFPLLALAGLCSSQSVSQLCSLQLHGRWDAGPFLVGTNSHVLVQVGVNAPRATPPKLWPEEEIAIKYTEVLSAVIYMFMFSIMH